jgi:asparagine synthase (glutamine-hydrolysing)
MLHADCMTRLADHLLPIVDRMSMAHSLEARAPFLDRRVVEFAMRIPAEWKLKRRRLKYVARQLGERHLPYELVHRKKQGFGFPLALWFRGRLRPLIQRVVSDSRLVDEHDDGAIDHNSRLWLLFRVELWYRHYIDREPVEALERWVDEALRG